MKNKAFSLIEVLVALALLSIIALYLIPSSLSLYRDSVKVKNASEEIFAVQAAIEKYKKEPIGTYEEKINNKNVMVTVSPYAKKNGAGLNIIKAKSGPYELEVIGEAYEKGI